MTIFDTDVLIWFFRGNSNAASFIHSEPDRAISIVSLMELIQGTRSKTEVAGIRGFVAGHEFNILAINESISYVAAALVEDHAHSHGLQVADALIAATAKERGATPRHGEHTSLPCAAGVAAEGIPSECWAELSARFIARPRIRVSGAGRTGRPVGTQTLRKRSR